MFYFDYLVGYMLTSPRKLPYYHSYMFRTYGSWYCSEEEFQKYWDSIPEETP
jgi:hypothetical protein